VPVARRRPPGARSPVAVLVALLVAALVACGGAPASTAPATPTAAPTSAGTATYPVTIEHAFGSTTIPASPRRVVTIGFNEADFALALGVVPVGVRDFIGEYAEESRPWAQEALGGATPEVVGGNELELEKIAALQPDVILGVYSFIDRATYERLSGIAPTVAPPSETVAATWQEQTRITGRALGTTERAEQVVADTEARFAEARFAEARAANPEFAGKTLAAGFVVGGETYALGTDDLRTQLFSDLGFTLPATSTRLSRELLGELDKDVLVVLGESRAAAEADQQLAALRVVRDGRVAYLGDFSTPFAGALGFGSPLSLPYALDIAVPALRSAVGGTPASI
jgi:iron complex transport system substrate-binding protein